MKLSHILKNLKLVERNREWLGAPIEPATKIAFYPAMLRSMAAIVLGRRREITYLNRPFYFDHPATPLNLQNYPHEIAVKLFKNMGNSRPATVLDIGANLGQFACTLSYFSPEARIDSFEPNPVVFDFLRKNATESMRLFNLAVAEEAGELPFYFERNRSGIGSFIKDNAGRADRLENIRVKTTCDISGATGRNYYDLIKIDVEGFEYEALQSLHNIRAKFLYIEVSGAGRARHYQDSQLLTKITDVFGPFDLLYSSGTHRDSPTYELLLGFAA